MRQLQKPHRVCISVLLHDKVIHSLQTNCGQTGNTLDEIIDRMIRSYCNRDVPSAHNRLLEDCLSAAETEDIDQFMEATSLIVECFHTISKSNGSFADRLHAAQ